MASTRTRYRMMTSSGSYADLGLLRSLLALAAFTTLSVMWLGSEVGSGRDARKDFPLDRAGSAERHERSKSSNQTEPARRVVITLQGVKFRNGNVT